MLPSLFWGNYDFLDRKNHQGDDYRPWIYLPGVSGGVLAAILGIYERIIRFLAHIRENFVENILFFIPVGIGGILGIALFSFPVEFLLETLSGPCLVGGLLALS